MSGYAAAMVDLAERHCESSQEGERRDAHRDMMALTLHIVVRTLFGADVDERTAGEVGSAFDVIVEEIAHRFRRPFRIPDAVPTPGNLRYTREVRRLDRLVFALIDERRRSGEERSDLLSLLLRARDEDGTRMTDRQLRDEVVTLFLAGHETTALALSWSCPSSPAIPSQAPRARSGSWPTSWTAARLRSRTCRGCATRSAVVHESLRLFPPAYVLGREAMRSRRDRRLRGAGGDDGVRRALGPAPATRGTSTHPASSGRSAGWTGSRAACPAVPTCPSAAGRAFASVSRSR